MVDGIEVRSVTPADAPGVTACLVRCYGDAYPKRWMAGIRGELTSSG